MPTLVPTFPPLVNSTGLSLNSSVVLQLLAANFSGATGSSFSIFLTAGNGAGGTGGLGVTKTVILETLAGSPTVINSAVITWGGLGSTVVPSSNTAQSDIIPFVFDAAHDYYVVIYNNDPSNTSMEFSNAASTDPAIGMSGNIGGDLTTLTSLSSVPSYLSVFRELGEMAIDVVLANGTACAMLFGF